MKSLLYRSSDLLYAFFPKKPILKFYCNLTYILRLITWRLACRYFGSDVIRYEGGIDEFILSQIKPGYRVLDVGCGDGNLSRIIARKAESVVGVDTIDKFIRIPGCDNIRFIAGNISNVEFRETFDLAVLMHTIEHLAESGPVLRRLSESARNILIETPDDESDWIYKMLKDLGIREVGDDTHVKLYNAESLRDELEQNGWTDVMIYRGYGAVRAVARSKIFK